MKIREELLETCMAFETDEKRGHAGTILDAADRKWLGRHFAKQVRFDEPMARHTTFRVGGPADAFVFLKTVPELERLLGFCRERALPYLIVGDGSNLLVKDGGIRGVVMVFISGLRRIKRVREENDTVVVQAMAGARTRRLCRFAAEEGLGGMNFAVGIPGTVGGALFMNAGTAAGCMADVVEAVEIMDPDGTVKPYPRKALDFSYRALRWGRGEKKKGSGGIVLSGSFRLHRVDGKKLMAEAEALVAVRKKTQPWRSRTAGCFFKNPPGDKSAGELIELAGLKGKRVGGARVSRRHANFIVNTGDATASEILSLAGQVRAAVSKTFGVDLEPEVKIVGS